MKITVIGAGVIGLACAYELSFRGHDVTVLDAGAVGAGGSAGNAGWITPFLSAPRAAPGAVGDAVRSFTSASGPARMRPHAEPAFASWVLRFLRASSARRSGRTLVALQELASRTHPAVDRLLERGVEFEHYRDGLAVVFKNDANLDSYHALASKMRRLGYAGGISTYRGSEVVDFDPAIARGVAGVMHLETERHVRPESLSAGLAAALRANGGRVFEHDAVTEIRAVRGGRWETATVGGRESREDLTCDTVIVAAGFPSRDLLRPLGVDVPLEAAKGTSMTAVGEGVAPSHPLKLYESMVACSPFRSGVRLSGTFDVGRRDFDMNRKRLKMVVDQGLTYLETWRPTKVEVDWVGHRPTSVDDAPIIGAVPGLPGLYIATGHGTLGVTLAPVTGDLVAREIDTGATESLLEPFRLTRFRSPMRRSAPA
ncbi:MAG: FAD-dependent oxidoreductase [Dermatophilus congolensis]|nr:FAD-dependent oxidoreductase [Dermatophilus congolensis]